MNEPQNVRQRSVGAERSEKYMVSEKENHAHIQELTQKKNTFITEKTRQGNTMADKKPQCPPGNVI
jgi:hypothetical protein